MSSVHRPNRAKEQDSMGKNAETRDDGVDDNTMEQELQASAKKQIIVKIRYQNQNPEAFLSTDESCRSAPDDNLLRRNPYDDNPEKSAADKSSPHDGENGAKPQIFQPVPNQYPGAKSLHFLNETSPHTEPGTTVYGEVLTEPDTQSSLPVFIKQEPGTSQLLEAAHEKQLQTSNAMDAHVIKEQNVMHDPGNTEPSGHSLESTAHHVSMTEHNGKSRKDGADEGTRRDKTLYENGTIEDQMNISLEKMLNPFDNLESSPITKNEDELARACPQQDPSGNDIYDGQDEHDENLPAIDILEDESHPEEAQSFGDDRLSGESGSEDQEGEPEEEDEMPHRGRMSSRAHSQALNSALNEAEIWEERLQQLEENLNRVKAAQLQHGSRPNIPPPGKSDETLKKEVIRPSPLQLPGTHYPYDISMAVNANTRNQNHPTQQRQQYEQRSQAISQHERQVLIDFHLGPPDFLGNGQVSTMNHSGGPQGGYPYGRFPQQDMGFQYPSYPPAPSSQMHPGHLHELYPPQAYNFSGRTSMPFAPDHWQTPRQDTSLYHTSEHAFEGKQEKQLSDSVSDDDEPLKERVKRYHSNSSHSSGIHSSPPPNLSEKKHQYHDQDPESELEFPDSTPKPKSCQTKNPLRMQRPLPRPTQAPEPKEAVSSPSSGSGVGSWKLPVFEVQRQPRENEDDGPLVKVSIPNLVREELLLSPDHADQEVHLLLNIFVPGQQALATPDPEPAVAVLNFHTIALMVVEAFVQFEIGDELGLGRGHWHGRYDQGDTEYNRVRNAKDANIDEIFFAIIDRWRAGLESKKKNLELIRGVQEFCDIALDIIYYIKEHGLLSTELEPKPRAERSDKGKTRGPRKGQEEESEEEETGKGKGKKRAAAQDTNIVHARKKAKSGKKAPAPKVKSKAKPKPKKSRSKATPGVTVIVKKRA